MKEDLTKRPLSETQANARTHVPTTVLPGFNVSGKIIKIAAVIAAIIAALYGLHVVGVQLPTPVASAFEFGTIQKIKADINNRFEEGAVNFNNKNGANLVITHKSASISTSDTHRTADGRTFLFICYHTYETAYKRDLVIGGVVKQKAGSKETTTEKLGYDYFRDGYGDIRFMGETYLGDVK